MTLLEDKSENFDIHAFNKLLNNLITASNECEYLNLQEISETKEPITFYYSENLSLRNFNKVLVFAPDIYSLQSRITRTNILERIKNECWCTTFSMYNEHHSLEYISDGLESNSVVTIRPYTEKEIEDYL